MATPQPPPVEFNLSKILNKALISGFSGSMAMCIQVCTLMWLRTTMNYQYRYGGTIKDTLKTLYSQGGVLRFYRGNLIWKYLRRRSCPTSRASIKIRRYFLKHPLHLLCQLIWKYKKSSDRHQGCWWISNCWAVSNRSHSNRYLQDNPLGRRCLGSQDFEIENCCERSKGRLPWSRGDGISHYSWALPLVPVVRN